MSVVNSLWTECLFEVLEKAKNRGDTIVDFKEVDDLVLSKSKELMLRRCETCGEYKIV